MAFLCLAAIPGLVSEIANRQPGMMMLISLGIIVAFGTSLAVLIPDTMQWTISPHNASMSSWLPSSRPTGQNGWHAGSTGWQFPEKLTPRHKSAPDAMDGVSTDGMISAFGKTLISYSWPRPCGR